ncbi:MAG: hypothetical protein LN412_05185 [Candidatus Thermoplasmatota archaeon]|nr:hypothetical protein [Candidatus Thermoplasmatota archaeon]
MQVVTKLSDNALTVAKKRYGGGARGGLHAGLEVALQGYPVYREGSRKEQPLRLPESRSKDICPDCGALLGTVEGSILCARCGYSDHP